MNQIRHLAIAAAEYSSRRLTLAENILSKFRNKNHMIILPSSDIQYETNHIPRPYHQDPNFYYYTGFMQKNAVLIMNIKNEQITSTLFIDKPSSKEILWDGPYPNEAKAFEITGVEDIGIYKDWILYLEKVIKDREINYIWTSDYSNCPKFSADFKDIDNSIPKRDITSFSDSQRVIKSPGELAVMRRSAQITSQALIRTMRYTTPGINEHEILGKLTYELSTCGGKLAYPPVIGGGPRANIIHYLEGDKCIDNDQLVLVDVGANVLGYFSDVTRTWPVNGRYSKVQGILYDILHNVHQDCVAICSPDKSLNDMLKFMLIRMSTYLVEEGILKDKEHIHDVCPHHIGHFLGLDIHDTPTIPPSTALAPGMVFPLEPGMYFPEDCLWVDPQFRGIGMRLEDDYAMAPNGSLECLTADLARSRTDIEALCARTDHSFVTGAI